MNELGKDIRSRIRDCLAANGVSKEHFLDVLFGLFHTSSKDRKSYQFRKLSPSGNPVAYASVSRTFDNLIVHLEDLGPVYRIWITRVNVSGGLQEILEAGELPWHEISSLDYWSEEGM